MTRAHALFFACTFAYALIAQRAAAQQPTAVPATRIAPAAEPAPSAEPASSKTLMRPRLYATVRFGRVGRAGLQTWTATPSGLPAFVDLEGTPNHVFGVGMRCELPVFENLTYALEGLVSGTSGADLTAGNDPANISYAPLEAGAVVAPRLLLAHDRVEARVQLMAGLSVLTSLEGEFPVKGQGPLNRYAYSDAAGFAFYTGVGLGATVWLGDRFSAFLELDLVQRSGGATFKPGLGVFDTGEPSPESKVSIDETYGALLIGFGWRLGGE